MIIHPVNTLELQRTSASCERYSYESVSLTCPISEIKMMDPVNPQGCQTTYDRENILKKIKGIDL